MTDTQQRAAAKAFAKNWTTETAIPARNPVTDGSFFFHPLMFLPSRSFTI